MNMHMQAILLALARAPIDSVDPSTDPGRLARAAAPDLDSDSYKRCLVRLHEDGLIRALVQPSGTSEYGMIYPLGLTSNGWRTVEAIRTEVALAQEVQRKAPIGFQPQAPA